MASYDDLEKLAKRANQRLRQLEKSGVSQTSQAYRALMMKAYDGRGAMRITKSGNIAFRRDFSKMSASELAELSEGLEQFFGLRTTTVRETKSAAERSYETYEKNARERGEPPLSKAEYNALWTSSATKAFGYEKVLRIAKRTGANIKQITDALAKSVEEQARLKRELSEAHLTQKVFEYMEKRK